MQKCLETKGREPLKRSDTRMFPEGWTLNDHITFRGFDPLVDINDLLPWIASPYRPVFKCSTIAGAPEGARFDFMHYDLCDSDDHRLRMCSGLGHSNNREARWAAEVSRRLCHSLI